MEFLILWIIVSTFSLIYSFLTNVKITMLHFLICFLTGPYVLINLTCRE